LVDLLELKGVRVFSLPEEVRDIDAFSFWRGDVPYIFLNTSKSSEHSRMDAGHELGHLVLHSSHGVPRGREEEREAQHFGAAFLMPRGSVIAGAPRSANVRDLIIAKHRWGVAVASLVYRMHQLGLLTDWQYRSLFIEMSASGYRQDEPSPIAHEASQVLAKVFSMLRADGLRRQDIARQLSIPVQELNKLVFGLVMTGMEGKGLGVKTDRPSSGSRELAMSPPGFHTSFTFRRAPTPAAATRAQDIREEPSVTASSLRSPRRETHSIGDARGGSRAEQCNGVEV